MAGIGDIKPLLPTYPKRPLDRVEKQRDKNEREEAPKRQPEDDDEKDDGKPHVDEFA